MSGEADDFDLLAASYVLGVLEPDEARAVEERAASDADMAGAIEAWQNRLAPLTEVVAPLPAPSDLWGRIETTLGHAPAPMPRAVTAPPSPSGFHRAWRSLPLWRTATAALALAAAYAGFVVLSRPEPTTHVAALAPAGSPAPAFFAQLQSDGSLAVRPLANVPVGAGKDMELWALPRGEKTPVSLGVLPQIGRQVTARAVLRPPMQLLVSLEPQGGSPTGAPTGPVLFAGSLE